MEKKLFILLIITLINRVRKLLILLITVGCVIFHTVFNNGIFAIELY